MMTLLFVLLSIQGSFAQDWNEYVQEALQNNPAVQAKRFAYEAALEDSHQVGIPWDPSVGVGIFVLPIETKMGAQRAKFSIQQTFPWWGTFAKQKQLSLIKAEQKKKEWEESAIELRLQMEDLWYPMIALQHQLRVYEKSLAILESYGHLSQKRLENGQGSLVDSVRVQMRVEALKTDIQIVSKRFAMMTAKFNILCHAPEGRTVELPDISTIEFESLVLSEQIQHPRVENFALEMQSWGLEKEIVAKQRMPNIGVGLEYIVVSPLPDNTESGGDAVVPTLRLQIPIFQKKYASQLAEISLQEKRTELSQQAWENNVQSQLAEIAFVVERCIEMRSLYRLQQGLVQQSIEIVLASYSVSGDRFEELLDWQQELLKYQLLEIELVRDYRMAMGKKQALTGDGNE